MEKSINSKRLRLIHKGIIIAKKENLDIVSVLTEHCPEYEAPLRQCRKSSMTIIIVCSMIIGLSLTQIYPILSSRIISEPTSQFIASIYALSIIFFAVELFLSLRIFLFKYAPEKLNTCISIIVSMNIYLVTSCFFGNFNILSFMLSVILLIISIYIKSKVPFYSAWFDSL